jgi:hypothetical protein
LALKANFRCKVERKVNAKEAKIAFYIPFFLYTLGGYLVKLSVVKPNDKNSNKKSLMPYFAKVYVPILIF